MKTNEQLKLKVLSAMSIALIGCLCWNGGSNGFAQSAPANQSPQVQEVVKLTRAKMSDDVIEAYIKNSGASYNLSADDILYLNSQGVSQPVISTLLANKSSAPAPASVPANVASAPISNPTSPAPPVASQVSPYPGGDVSPYPNQPVPGPVEAAPGPTADINLAYFQAQMSHYGEWIDVPGQGLCFRANVAAATPGWRPYLNEGHWIYTDDGWTWASDYPWGQYAFHYGRWFNDPRLGWMWAPGYTWGPAWVSWRNADASGYLGWAPLPPGAVYREDVGLMWDGRVAVDADFGLGVDAYVFLPFDHFWVHDYLAWRAPSWRVHDLFGVSILANHFGFVGGRFFFGGIGRDRMAVLSHHEVVVDHLAIHDSHILRAREVDHARAVDFHGGDHGGFDHGHDVGHDSGHGFGHDYHDGH